MSRATTAVYAQSSRYDDSHYSGALAAARTHSTSSTTQQWLLLLFLVLAGHHIVGPSVGLAGDHCDLLQCMADSKPHIKQRAGVCSLEDKYILHTLPIHLRDVPRQR
eukprot:14414-Heterococcus_DN1.PRE.5